ncbi:bactericidal permeability-increasing protein-like [Pyxicephalus adspersus]|uniref:bactericidal permeability-increasing protein-like n=1 Tax=Pyxicephalus adspersus TaxID=30357 RepID=UPI003B5BB5F1
MKAVLIFSFAFVLSEAKNTDPGVIGRLTLKGLQYGLQVGLQELHKQLPTIHIPDVDGSVSVAVLGHVRYYVSELQIKTVDFSHSNLTFCPNTGINISIQHGRIQIVGHIRIKSWLFSASSWMELWVQGFSLDGSVGTTCDDLGHGAVWNAACRSKVGWVDLSFHGGSGWVFNMFKNSMIGPIYSAISSQICPSFGKAIIQVEKTLSTLPVSLSVDSVSDVEIDLVGPPLISNNSFDLLVRGEFVALSQHMTPYRPEKLVLPDVDSRMLLLALSQFSANSAGFVHYKVGFLKYNITDDMIPKSSPIRLNMKSLQIFAPELLTRYPDSPPLLLQVSARSAPTVTCLLDSLTVQGSADIDVFAMYTDRPLISLFQLQADFLIGVDLVLSEETVGATISVGNFSLSLIHSNVGTVKVDTMQKTLNVAMKILLPILNGRLKKIIPLPSILRLQNPVVRVLQGYIVIMTDLQATLRHDDNFLDFSNLFDGRSFELFLKYYLEEKNYERLLQKMMGY